MLYTKNHETRVVLLKGMVLQLLREINRVRRLDRELLFPGKNPQSPVVFQKHWVKVLSAAQVKDFRFHDLRHTAASNLAMNGASLMEISEILGHKTLLMVKRYTHLTESHTSGVVEKIKKCSVDEVFFREGTICVAQRKRPRSR
jgi:integrase